MVYRRSGGVLTREILIDATIAFIAKNGVDGFTVRALAKSIGVFPTTITWHLGTKEEVLSKAAWHVLSKVSVGPVSCWQEFVEQFSHAYRRTLHQNPNFGPLMGARLMISAGTDLTLVERLLAGLAGAGLEGGNLVDAYNAVIGSVVGFVTLELATSPSESDWVRKQKESWGRVDEHAYPTLAKALPALRNRSFVMRWKNGVESPLDSSFELMLRMLIEGLEALVKRSAAVTAPAPRRRRSS
jgi:TetR/AcrR family transcriptional regulator, tetracycline repressor protein